MANPLKQLDLIQSGFQHIFEIPVAATPAKVWTTVLHPGSWFGFDPDRSSWSKHTLELAPGGKWTSKNPNGNEALMAMVTLIEPGKLLRLTGPIGLSHLPVINVIIFELQPQADGKSTLLRVAHRCSGYMDAEVEKRYHGAWTHLLGQLKGVAEQG